MRFHLWRRSDRSTAHQAPDRSPRLDPLESIDLDQWAEQSDSPLPCPAPKSGENGVGHLGRNLLAVLADEEASLIPPSAGDMTQDEWNELSDAEREGFRRLQLKRVDPRFVSHYTMNGRRVGSRGARVYR